MPTSGPRSVFSTAEVIQQRSMGLHDTAWECRVRNANWDRACHRSDTFCGPIQGDMEIKVRSPKSEARRPERRETVALSRADPGLGPTPETERTQISFRPFHFALFAVLSVQIARFREDVLCKCARQTESWRDRIMQRETAGGSLL
jgi:hypothetical protein